ncbi:WRKY transcription factor 55 [Gastrolobium bilobum]|uniref:WRKY transcription factor 55 n=1 Tax=Gastrolobium bilobum TaxID=150636 RepID=UPI002AB25C00|nr:WRKY transcription factor 55 [Gastrolobium bilobum]
MEEVLNSIKHACELARNLETELTNMANQPNMLSLSIDEVVKTFGDAKERLLMMMSQQNLTITASSSSSFPPMLLHEHAQIGASPTSMQGLLGSGSYAQAMVQQQPFDVRTLLETKIISGGDLQQLRYRGTLQIGEMGGRDLEGSAERSKGSEGEMQGIEASPSRQRKSSRKNDPEKKTMMIPAPLVGNTEMPREDGFTWRKYGQKEILGKKYPRGYFRCTHQKLYGCPAKKQVQRLNDNPNIFEVTYRGEHTCYMSSTAPSSFPQTQLLMDISNDMNQTTISPRLSTSSTSVSAWLSSANLNLQGGGDGGGSSSGGGAGPSTSKYVADYPVVDMADAMFNSGISSGHSMESLFPPAEDKWEQGEKKN